MWAMCAVTMTKLKEPAFVMLFVLGGILAYSVASLGSVDLGATEMLTDKSSATKEDADVMAGTLLIVIMGCLITVFGGATEIPRDISSRMIAVYLSKPLSRREYLWGKFMGILAISVLFVTAWLAIMLVARGMGDAETKLTMSMIFRQLCCVLLLVPVTAIAVAISCYLSDVPAMIITAVYLLLGFFAGLVPIIASVVPGTVGKLLFVPYYFSPNLTYFLQAHAGFWAHASLFAYAVTVGALFTAVGHLQFRQGDVF